MARETQNPRWGHSGLLSKKLQPSVIQECPLRSQKPLSGTFRASVQKAATVCDTGVSPPVPETPVGDIPGFCPKSRTRLQYRSVPPPVQKLPWGDIPGFCPKSRNRLQYRSVRPSGHIANQL
jgi:hypothetical protein